MEPIIAYFTEAGVPQTGLSPIINTFEARTGEIINSDQVMTEMAGSGNGHGWYRYIFNPDEFYKGNYCYSIDGTATITTATERYQYGIV